MYGTLTGTNYSDQNGPGSNDNEGMTPHSPALQNYSPVMVRIHFRIPPDAQTRSLSSLYECFGVYS